jgi:hypothetical protein
MFLFVNFIGVEVGRTWESREECSALGVHVASQAYIHSGPAGAYDTDHGEWFICAGESEHTLKEKKKATLKVILPFQYVFTLI